MENIVESYGNYDVVGLASNTHPLSPRFGLEIKKFGKVVATLVFDCDVIGEKSSILVQLTTNSLEEILSSDLIDFKNAVAFGELIMHEDLGE